MRIAHVQVIPHLSGAQRISLDLLSSINCSEHELFMICSTLQDFSSDFIREFNKAGVEIIEVPSLKREIGLHDIAAFDELYKIFKKYNFDIIHTNSTKPAILARVAARLAGCRKIIHTVHGIAFHSHIPIIKRSIFYIAELFSVFFGHKNISVNNYYKKFYPFVDTQVIYNGVDFSSLDVKSLHKDFSKKITFAFFARLDCQKNPLEFIEAINLLNSKSYFKNRNVEFIIAGDGDLSDLCEKNIKKYGLNNIIKSVGWISDKSNFFNKIDVIVQPSKWEAFGLVFVEAGYFAIPAIATRVEGIPEVVIDGESGLLYSGGAENLSKCIAYLIENPNMIEKLGLNARLRYEKIFTKEKMISKYHQLYFSNTK